MIFKHQFKAWNYFGALRYTKWVGSTKLPVRMSVETPQASCSDNHREVVLQLKEMRAVGVMTATEKR